MRPFNARLSAQLDYATVKAEERGGLWRPVKRWLEWRIFG